MRTTEVADNYQKAIVKSSITNRRFHKKTALKNDVFHHHFIIQLIMVTSNSSHTKDHHPHTITTTNPFDNQPTVSSAMAPLTYNEERNILICGPRSSGKTSLGFTLCRGIFPESAGLLPGRFEGWSIGACATPISALTATASYSQVSSAAGTTRGSSVKVKSGRGSGGGGGGKDPSQKPYFVNFTFWEDRPRLGLDLPASKKNSTASTISTSNHDPVHNNVENAGEY